jgi:hypothetical protein
MLEIGDPARSVLPLAPADVPHHPPALHEIGLHRLAADFGRAIDKVTLNRALMFFIAVGTAGGVHGDNADVLAVHWDRRVVDVAGVYCRCQVSDGSGAGRDGADRPAAGGGICARSIRGQHSAILPLCWPVAGCATPAFTGATTETALLVTAMVYAAFADIGSLVMMVYTLEVYPVRIRSNGPGIAMGWGRFGGMVSPVVAGFLISADNLVWVRGLMAAFQFTSPGLTLLMAHETSGRNLEAVAKPAVGR